MKKILIISSLLLFINMAFASDLIIADSTKNKSETRLVIFGKFDKSNTVVTIDIYYSPLTGSIDDEWGYDKRLQLSNNYVLTFDIDQIYMLVINQLDQPSRTLYVKASVPGFTTVNISLYNTNDGILYYDSVTETYKVYKFE
jgi:hypothetical protein